MTRSTQPFSQPISHRPRPPSPPRSTRASPLPSPRLPGSSPVTAPPPINSRPPPHPCSVTLYPHSLSPSSPSVPPSNATCGSRTARPPFPAPCLHSRCMRRGAWSGRTNTSSLSSLSRTGRSSLARPSCSSHLRPRHSSSTPTLPLPLQSLTFPLVSPLPNSPSPSTFTLLSTPSSILPTVRALSFS